MNSDNKEIRQVFVPAKDIFGAVFGWLALISGIGAIVLWGIIFVPLALLFSGLSLWRKNWIWGGVGGVLGVIGIALSPTIWGLFAGLFIVVSVPEIKGKEKTQKVEVRQTQLPAPKPVKQEVLQTLKLETFAKDDQLAFETAKIIVDQTEWCKATTDIALIVKRNGFISNSLGILETASQLASFECAKANRFDVMVFERAVEGDLKVLTDNSYFSTQMIHQNDGRWVSQ
jgi:hypothetical protein